eukprot:UC1_evm1s1842
MTTTAAAVEEQHCNNPVVNPPITDFLLSYVSSLPEQAPDLASWPPHLLGLLDGTEAHATAEATLSYVRCCHKEFFARFRREHANMFHPDCELSLVELNRCRGLILSRCFPHKLSGREEPKAPSPAFASAAATSKSLAGQAPLWRAVCLVPGLDMLNHAPGTKISWEVDMATTDGTGCIGCSVVGADVDTEQFGTGGQLHVVAGTPVRKGHQVFNNYGHRGNNELLCGYGFCLPRNEADSCTLVLRCRDEDGATAELGRFNLGWYDASRRQVRLPSDLVVMLNEFFADESEEEEKEEEEEEVKAGEVAAGATSNDATVALDPMAIAMVYATLEAKYKRLLCQGMTEDEVERAMSLSVHGTKAGGGTKT